MNNKAIVCMIAALSTILIQANETTTEFYSSGD